MAVATQVKAWTLDELHRLPEDGNRYELARGELFVTPPPTDEHETIAATLSAILSAYVRTHDFGLVFRPQAVMRHDRSQVEPDLMVRRRHPARSGTDNDWSTAPVPILVVEIASPYTRRRDRVEKKQLHLDAGVAEYWIVEPKGKEVHVTRPGVGDNVMRDRERLTRRVAIALIAAVVAGCSGEGTGSGGLTSQLKVVHAAPAPAPSHSWT